MKPTEVWLAAIQKQIFFKQINFQRHFPSLILTHIFKKPLSKTNKNVFSVSGYLFFKTEFGKLHNINCWVQNQVKIEPNEIFKVIYKLLPWSEMKLSCIAFILFYFFKHIFNISQIKVCIFTKLEGQRIKLHQVEMVKKKKKVTFSIQHIKNNRENWVQFQNP